MNQTEISIAILESMFSAEEIEKLKEIKDNIEEEIPSNIPEEISDVSLYDDYGDMFGNPKNDKENRETEEIILGSYTPMNSPGIITFYKENIKKYSGTLIRKVLHSGVSLGLDSVLFPIYFIVEDVWNHESFHYYCDYQRYITNSEFIRNKEEAYAVAHSYQKMHEWHTFYHSFVHHGEFQKFFSDYYNGGANTQNCLKRSKKIFDVVLKEHFENYKSDGYKDWGEFKDRISYETFFFDYLKNTKLDSLLKNGVPVNDIWWQINHLGNKGTVILLK